MKFLVVYSFFFYCFFIQQSEQDGGEDFIRSSRKFTAELYQSIAVEKKENFIFSPFSLETILALVSEGAVGETKTELMNGLFLPNSTVALQNALKIIDSSNGVNLKTTNSIFANISVTVNSNFKQIASEIYGAEFQNLNFADSVESADSMNKWVDDQTNHKITNLVTPEEIEDANMFLINAIYFNAPWKHPFFENILGKRFHNYGRDSIEIPFMTAVHSYNYYTDEELKVSFIEIPHVGKSLSMVIILPDNNDGLESIETNVHALYETPNWFKRNIIITLPRFEVESTFHFVNILNNLGIKKLFRPGAELDNLADSNQYVQDIVQKAFINVTESGTEAAAASYAYTVPVSAISAIGRIKVNVDHPFMYYIQKDGIILFAGRVNCFKN